MKNTVRKYRSVNSALLIILAFFTCGNRDFQHVERRLACTANPAKARLAAAGSASDHQGSAEVVKGTKRRSNS